jgi:hypothetical protein
MALRMSQAVVAFDWTGIQPANEGDAIVRSSKMNSIAQRTANHARGVLLSTITRPTDRISPKSFVVT